jgi:TrmH family RNA methyltransferase
MITSLQNARVKAAAKLRDARGRHKQGRIIIDGARELTRALDAGVEMIEVFVCEELCRSSECLKLLEATAGPAAHEFEVLHVTRSVFEKLAFGERTEGVIGIAHAPSTSLSHLAESLRDSLWRLGEPQPREGTAPLIAVLEGIEKPGNVGAVLRSADAAGVSALIVADGGTDLYNPNAIRASLGTIFTMPVCATSSAETLTWLVEHRLPIYAAWVDADIEYTDVDFNRPCAIVLGSEAQGLSDRWRSKTPSATGPAGEITAIKLPMLGVADSLNVSNTAAVLFYEALRQRRTVESK